MRDDLKRIVTNAERTIRAAGTAEELEARRIEFLGRERGALTLILRRLKDLPPADRRRIGARANRLREKIEILLREREETLKQSSVEKVLAREWVDVSRPGVKPLRGHLHPLTQLIRDIERIFSSLGFAVAEGPEVETEYHNFDALNIPEHHPARDMWDTFWIKTQNLKLETQGGRKQPNRLLLRAHTSPVQIRYMEATNPPLSIITPGRVFRYEATDVSHEIQFYQLEGLMVDRDVSIANFKAVIDIFFSRLFGTAMEVRLRPSYFPFVEPAFEVDMRQARAPQAKWVEISGAGMVHPSVFKAVGYNPKQWQGFAFGMGIERLAMLKYNIPDIRLFHSGDIRFLKQF